MPPNSAYQTDRDAAQLEGDRRADVRPRAGHQPAVGRTIRFIAGMPPHVCINELVITPTFNRSYLGRPEIRRG